MKYNMWLLKNHTPFEAERSWVRDKDGAEVWLVAVKGTFIIGQDGSTKVADEQMKVLFAPEFRGVPNQSSLIYDSDLYHTKMRTDVILHGYAYAPGGRPTKMVEATLKIANIQKTVRVFGDRIWERSLIGVTMSEPKRLTRMPLIYERAFGGADVISKDPREHDWEPRNPVGTGFAHKKEHLIAKPAPNIEDPRSLITHWKSRPDPIGFGPIAGHWSPRLQFAGTYDEKWEKERLPLLPYNFDERFYQCAPEDQQVPGFVKGGTLVELYNMTPRGFLRFRLPLAGFVFRTRFAGRESREHRAVLHTVILEPDVPRVIMVWHTSLPCHHDADKLLETTIIPKKQVLVPKEYIASGVWIGEQGEE